MPSGMFGLQWHPAYEAFYEDDGGVAQDFITGDQVVFTPEPSMDWLDWLEGTYPVPSSVGSITPDAVSSLANVSLATVWVTDQDDATGRIKLVSALTESMNLRALSRDRAATHQVESLKVGEDVAGDGRHRIWGAIKLS